jgi:transcription elongation factor GreA
LTTPAKTVSTGGFAVADPQMEKVARGMWVKLTGFVPGQEEVFHLVSEAEANVLNRQIPPSSPLARALEGARVGDTVSLGTPGGKVDLTVLEAGRS